MESTPSYPSEERGTSRDRDGRERSYQPSPPAERFSDLRRQEAPRLTRAPLEGVIHIRPEAPVQKAPVSEAAQTHMQQQFEQADRAKDKDEKRVDQPAPQPQQPEPITPLEARPATEAPVETSTLDQQRTEAEPANTEQNEPKIERPEPAGPGEQPIVQSEQSQEDTPQEPDFQRTWYYTPPVPAQQIAAERPVPATYTPEQPLQPVVEASDAPLPEPGGPDAWRQYSPQAAEYGTEQPAPAAPYSSWEAPTSDATEAPPEPDTTWSGADSWFGTGSALTSSEQPAVVQSPTPGGGGDGPRPPRNPYEGSFGNSAPEPTESRYTSHALIAPTPSARLEYFMRRHEHPHTHRGLVTGIVGGLLLVHILSKRRDNKLSERIDELQKENATAHKQTHAANQELQHTQQALRTEQQKSQDEIAKLREATPAPEAQQSYAPPTAETRADISGAPVYAAAGVAAANQAPNQPVSQEQRPIQAQQSEQQPDPNQQQESVDQYGNPIRLRPGEHVKRSEWLTYVEKDGHVVPGAIEYGRAFQEEQHQELGHTPRFGGDQGAAQGPVFGANQDMYGVNPSLPSGMVGPSLPVGSHADPQHQLPEHTKSGKQVVSNVANPWFWLMLALIFAAFFITITV